MGALGFSFILVPVAVIFCVVYLLLPFKLWRMADRIKEMRVQTIAQTKLIEQLVGYTIRRELNEQELKRQIAAKLAALGVENRLI